MTEHDMRPGVRWSILQTLQVGGHLGATEPMMQTVLREQFPVHAKQHVLRDQLAYLEDRGLLQIERSEIQPWRATLTRHGVDVTEYTIDCEPGIARPQKYWDAKSGRPKQR